MRQVKEIHLVRRPNGLPRAEDFTLVEKQLPELAPGEVAIQNLLISIDPYIRLRLDDEQALHTTIFGGGLGRVVQSRNPSFHEGNLVRHFAGFCDGFVSNGTGLIPITPDPEIPLTAQVHALGGIGLCAYGGLLGTGALKDGEQVFVSSAAGAVGSLAVQIAKIKDCYVVGSAGSDAKVKWLSDKFHLDAVINYKTQPIKEALAAATPEGIDVYFDNVGGEHLEAALPRMNQGGRIPVCGMISTYNDDEVPVAGLASIISNRVLIKGFGFKDFPDLEERFRADMSKWIKSGQLKFFDTVFEGLEQTPNALIGLFQGLNTGKMLVHVAD